MYAALSLLFCLWGLEEKKDRRFKVIVQREADGEEATK